jgi:peptidoglycan/xylan/chitin deacetylase (PgdA/CDA1 family)
MRVFIGFFLLACLAIPARGQSRSVAITIDDLPCANCAPVNPDGTSRHGLLESTNQRLVAELTRAHIPVTGFVITQSADQAGTSGQYVLRLWLDAGFDLGSHSYSHPNFADITEAEMEAEITRADATLRPLLAANGRKLQFFRFPYNDTGDTQAKHDAVATFLNDHGYQVATCTIDTSDYTFAAAYVHALGANDTATAARVRREYIAYSASEIDFYAASCHSRKLNTTPPTRFRIPT